MNIIIIIIIIIIITTVAQIVQCLLAHNARRRPLHSSISNVSGLFRAKCAANAAITFYDFQLLEHCH